MPPSVLGGASVVMFSMMIVSGINQVTEVPLKGKNATILAVAVATIVAIILNIILPEDKIEVK